MIYSIHILFSRMSGDSPLKGTVFFDYTNKERRQSISFFEIPGMFFIGNNGYYKNII